MTTILHSARPSTNTLKFLQIHTIAFGDGYFYNSFSNKYNSFMRLFK
jgi:hypothetical protein